MVFQKPRKQKQKNKTKQNQDWRQLAASDNGARHVTSAKRVPRAGKWRTGAKRLSQQ